MALPQRTKIDTSSILTCRHFNQSMQKAALPNGLQFLTFGEGFNQCMVKAALPGGLQSLTIGSGVSQGWAKVALPCVHI